MKYMKQQFKDTIDQRTETPDRWGTNEMSPIYDCLSLPPWESPGPRAWGVVVIGAIHVGGLWTP